MSSPNPIFLDPEKDASDATFYLGAYYPPGHSNFKAGPGSKTFSQLIWDIKKPQPQHMNFQWRWNHMKKAVEYFSVLHVAKDSHSSSPLYAHGYHILTSLTHILSNYFSPIINLYSYVLPSSQP
jgi:hypothetical protein